MFVLYVVDSANLDLVERWIAEGHLPNIAALWQSSLTAQVGGPAYFDEIGSWLSAYSGIPSTHHGYYSARYLVPGTYRLERRTLASAPAPPFWTRLPSGARALILEPIEAYAIEGLTGDQMFNLTAHQEAYAAEPFQALPEAFGRDVLREFGDPPKLRFDKFEEPLEYYRGQAQVYRDVLERRGKLFEKLIRRGGYDAAVVGFPETHDAAHILWHFFDGRAPDRDPKGELAGELLAMYCGVDREIGRIQTAVPPGSTVCLLSTYGMKDQYPTVELAEQLMTLAGFTRKVPAGPSSWKPLDIARRLVPEPIRHRISQHLPNDVQQSLLASNFAGGIDWSQTRAVALPTSLFSSHIRVNLKGREPDGIVEPGAAYNALLDEIEAEFRKLIDPKTDRPAVAAVLRTANVHIDGPSHLLPDLYVHWRSARHFLDRAIHPLGEITQRKHQFHRSSYHQRPGFMALAGPGIAPARMEREIALEDIAPTFRDILGCPAQPGVGQSVLAAAHGGAM